MAKQVQSESERIAAEALANSPVAPKGRATPTRKQREAARKRPLVGGNTPEARALSKEQQRTQLERARIGRANGDEKFLPARDRGPQKRFIRDFVDARWSFAELLLPVVFIIVIAQFTISDLKVQSALQLAMYGFFFLVVIDLIVLTFQIRRALTAKFGEGRVDRVGLYAIMRAIYFRGIRVPKAQVKRGAYPR